MSKLISKIAVAAFGSLIAASTMAQQIKSHGA